MRGPLAIVLLATGCTRILGVHDFPPEPVADTTCYGTLFPVCITGELPDPRTLSGPVDTDDPTCAGALADGTPVCIIAATDLTVSTIRVSGALPLVLVAHDQLTIAGTLDAASHRTGDDGPNANPTQCLPATPGWGDDTPSGLRWDAGGAGGSFGGAGGDGGGAQSSSGNGMVGGGHTNPVATAVPLPRGGCAGSVGGVPTLRAIQIYQYPALTPATAGAGGGAVVLIADAIEIDGTIDASGAGGGGGQVGANLRPAGGGGGGGGSGGLVALDTAIILGTGTVVANGGGGGAGAGTGNGAAGTDGGPPYDIAAAGGGVTGFGVGGGGAGGGLTPAVRGGEPLASADSGSGGGGGGAGIILARVALDHASPAPSPP